ncbi:polysaccharide biosynthesis/export family protein [Novosphingobium sp. PhB165]|uniref:polysaccharide biosynthesis/export family protein n=1 Tax=Novosphingobium sp. PhB165 TaxID=2485105 RepID=UPI0014043301|nr:polysaccharide biosynthesis/export family protein [Novosphingobium sp. PhB165]
MSIRLATRVALALAATFAAAGPGSAWALPGQAGSAAGLSTVPLDSASPNGAAMAVAARDDRYKLGAGDKVRITVFGEAAMTGDYAVAPNGEISFPLIGGVEAKGHTLDEVAQAIRGRLLKGYLNDPRVAIDLLEYRTFFILGEVNRPGAYPFTAGLTLGQAVATAGGYTYRARKSKVRVRHDGAPQDEMVDIKDIGGLAIEPGDTVTVPERFF